MHLDHTSATYLKLWMINKLRPMQVFLSQLQLSLSTPQLTDPDLVLFDRCDADLTVLSDYVIALLRHDQPIPELKESCTTQLDDFLHLGLSNFTSQTPSRSTSVMDFGLEPPLCLLADLGPVTLIDRNIPVCHRPL